MSITKHYNFEYDGGAPNLVKNIGDRFFSQDQSRQYNYFMDRMGQFAYDILGSNVPCILTGLVATKGAGDTISITAGIGFATYDVTVQSGAWTNPPSTTTEEIDFIRIVVGALSDQATASKNNDNVTTNYIKISYTDTDGNTRTREKKAGTYAYEQTPAYTLTIDDVAATDNDIVLGEFVTVAGAVPYLIDYSNKSTVLGGVTAVNTQFTPRLDRASTSFATAGIGNPAIAALTSTKIAMVDSTLDLLETYDYDGTTWTKQGNSLNLAGIGHPSISALSSTDIAFIDETNADLRRYTWNGTDWVQVGVDAVIAGMGEPSLSAMGAERVCFVDHTNDDLRVYDWNGGTTKFEQTGNDLVLGGVALPKVTGLSFTRCAYIDTTNDDLRVYEFDEDTGDWTQVGNDLNISGVGTVSMDSLDFDMALTLAPSPNNTHRIVFFDTGLDVVAIYEFDGTDWKKVGGTLEQLAAVTAPAITILDERTVAYNDSNNIALVVANINWNPVF